MHEEVPVSPIQCCQVTFVYGLQKPFWLLHNLCQSSECQSPVLPVLLGPVMVPQEQTGPCWQQGIPFSSSLSLTWVTYCHLHLQLHFLRRSVPFSSHQPCHRCNVVNSALFWERDNPVWSWLSHFQWVCIVFLLGSSSQYS